MSVPVRVEELAEKAARVRRYLTGMYGCPNYGIEPHGGCEYCARIEDARADLDSLVALASRATQMEAECRRYWERLVELDPSFVVSRREPTDAMFAHAEKLARERGWKDVRP